MRVDAFFRTYNRHVERRRVVCVVFEAREGAELAELLELAHKAGAKGRGSSTGIFELQTDEGIWSREDGKPLERRSGKLAAFATWAKLEELERLEERAA